MSLPRILFAIMVLKSKPQDIEYNVSQLFMLVLLYLFSGMFVLSQSVDVDVTIYNMLLDAVILALFSVGCLMLLQLKARIVQTLAALFGSGIVFHMLAWPIVEQLGNSDITDSNKSSLSLLFLMLLSWQILVYAHIYKNALSVDMTKAVVLSISYWLMSMTLSQMILPIS